MSFQKKRKPTHFLSLPLTHDVFQQRFNQFKEEVLKNCPDVEPLLFQSSSRLHMTFGVLRLFSNGDEKKASNALEECNETVIKEFLRDRKELGVRMQGLGYLGKNPKAAFVLYAKLTSPVEPTLLQNITNSVSNYFIGQGLTEKEYDEKNVLIHVTLMNSKFYAKQNEKGKRYRYRTFDATKILELYSDYDFGEACVTKMDLSKMGAYSESGFWKAASSVNIF